MLWEFQFLQEKGQVHFAKSRIEKMKMVEVDNLLPLI